MAPDIGGLYELHGPSVYRYIRSRGFDEQSAADILHETFLAAWRKRDGFTGSSQPLTWLIGIARHKLADETRRRERTRAAPLPESGQADDFSTASDDRLVLRDALGSLEPEHLELVNLVLVTGLTYAEAAVILGIPEGTVKSRMYQIRTVLRSKMKGGDRR